MEYRQWPPCCEKYNIIVEDIMILGTILYQQKKWRLGICAINAKKLQNNETIPKGKEKRQSELVRPAFYSFLLRTVSSI